MNLNTQALESLLKNKQQIKALVIAKEHANGAVRATLETYTRLNKREALRNLDLQIKFIVKQFSTIKITSLMITLVVMFRKLRKYPST